MSRPPALLAGFRSALRRGGRATTALALLAALPFAALPLTAATPARADTVSASNWMSAVPDGTSLTAMSIPGTHETLAIHGLDAVRAQYDHGDSADTMLAQLNSGIRAVDIRVRVFGDAFTIHHGAFYQNANFDDVLTKLKTFLDAHPSETVLMRVHPECERGAFKCIDVPDDHVVPENPEDYAARLDRFTKYRDKAAYAGLFYAPSVSGTSQAAVPDLEAVRGKVVLTSFDGFGNFGLAGYRENEEDHYQANSAYEKWPYVHDHLQQTVADTTSSKMYVTYSSANNFPAGSVPYQIAVGFTSTTGDSAGLYIPRVNDWLRNYAVHLDDGRTAADPVRRMGVVMMDYPDDALVEAVRAHNPLKAQTSPVPTPAPVPSLAGLSESVGRAYSFLTATMDSSRTPATGPEELNQQYRIPRSYQGGYFDDPEEFGPKGFQASFTYDDALVITALLRDPHGANLSHAVALGDSLIYAQNHDPKDPGQKILRASYEPDPFVTANPGNPVYVGSFSVYTGNMSWAGMALTRLYAVTGQQRFLDGARKIAEWIRDTTRDTRGTGGFTGGLKNSDETGAEMTKIQWKATEHNIDAGAFFHMLGTVTGDHGWESLSQEAFTFVKSMLTPNRSHLWTGTGNDGVSANEDYEPEDVQAWSYLATHDQAYSPALDWTAGRLQATDGPFTGVSFSAIDTSKVWFEGTGHLAAALLARGNPAGPNPDDPAHPFAADRDRAAVLLDTLMKAQTAAPNADGNAIVAASNDGLDTGQGDTYYAARHTGATAWYVIAATGGNPFRL
ncbi:phosphatidylinositol-specific phospholipase C domain-containing protein [Kitasatospora purpeofusca]|uniref:phosphatidylinositol-specific phospholipase C domain-containing protein n=1 Tax=Kitasatospora purpeofusca TaxID=67352 RepID=UPI0037FC505B